MIEYRHLSGGKLAVKDLKNLLNASYDISTPTDEFVLDNTLSTATSKVYRNGRTGQVVVSHRGTEGAKDWLNNGVFGLFGDWGYKKTDRYKEAERVQIQAERKYGAPKVSTIGHSQGGLQAQLLGNNSRETITLNKATRIGSNSKANANEYDIRSSGDVVSALNPFAKKNPREIVIKNTGRFNPLAQHSIDILNNLPQTQLIGQGRKPLVVRVVASPKKGKRYRVIFPDGKKVDFGSSSYENYTIHNDEKRKRSYLLRHEKRENWNDESKPAFWSRWYLWNKTSLEESAEDIKKRFGIEIV